MRGNLNMEVIMAQLREHLLPTIDSGANGNVHHYNRVWEKIEAWVSKPPNQVNSDVCTICHKDDAIINSRYGRVCYYCGCPESTHD